MKIVFLGTGPTKPVRKATEQRTNSSIFLVGQEHSLLIDCTPTFLEQVRREMITRIDAVLLTHAHKDCIGGLPDLDEFVDTPINVYAPPRVLNHKRLKRKFKNLKLVPILPHKKTRILEFNVIPFRVIHAEAFPTGKDFPTYGYRIEDIVYAEDMERIPKESERYFRNAKIIIADAAMWFNRQIRGHMNVAQSLEIAKKFEPQLFVLIQAGHTYPPQEEAQRLIDNYVSKLKLKSKVILAYDGLILDTENLSEIQGIYLTHPHAYLIWIDSKDLIVKSREFKNQIGKRFYLLSKIKGKGYCFGIIKLKSIKKIDLREFELLRERHKITEHERLAWWPKAKILYAYEFDKVQMFEEPKQVSIPKGIQTFVKNVKFYKETAETGATSVAGSPITGFGLLPIWIWKPKKKKKKTELIESIADYDPKVLNNEQLADDWRIVCAWYSTYKETNGKGIKYSLETIINLAKLIYDEINERVKAGTMKHTFKPDEMKEHSRELYYIVSRMKLSLKDLDFLKYFKDFKIIKNCISVVGSTVKNYDGHEPNDIDLLIRMSEPSSYLKRAIEIRILKMFPPELQPKIHFVWGDPEGSHDDFLPLYDLKLERIKDASIVRMSELQVYTPQKPYGAAFYQIDKLKDNLDKDKEYRVEHKYNGFHVVVIKKGDNVKIYSEQKKDITDAFPTLVEEIKKLSDADFAIDGELVIYDNDKALGRAPLMKFIMSRKAKDDKNIRLHVWDITFYKQDLTHLPLRDRLNYLSKLRFTDRIEQSKAKNVKGIDNVIKAVNWASNLKNSEGAVIKELDAPYYKREHPSWIKYRHLSRINVIVLEVHKKERGLYNYTVGIPADKVWLNRKRIVKLDDKKYLKLGRTFNTKQLFKVGDKIQLLIEEIWRHLSKRGVHYSIHKPRVVGKTAERVSTLTDLDDLVVSIGFEVKHSIIDNFEMLESKELAEGIRVGHEGEEIYIKDFPKRMQKNFREVMNKKLWLPFVMQWHLRGKKSLHTDHRFLIPDGYLEGFTYFSPPSIDKPDKIVGNVTNVRGTIKVPQPKIWLKVEGRLERGAPGSTAKYPSYFAIVAKGKYTIHEVTDHKIVFELKCDEGDVTRFKIRKGEEYIKELNKKLPKKLKNLDGCYSFHIAHIGEHYIILLDKVSCPKK